MGGEGQEQSGPDLDRLRSNFDAERTNLIRWRAFVMIVSPIIMLGFMLPYGLLRYDYGRLEAWSALIEAQQQIHTLHVEPLIEVRASVQTWVELYDAHVTGTLPIGGDTPPVDPNGVDLAAAGADDSGVPSPKPIAGAVVATEVANGGLTHRVATWCRLDETADPVTCLANGNGLIQASLTGYAFYRGTLLIADGIDEVRCPAVPDMPELPTIDDATRALVYTLHRAQGHLDRILEGEGASPPERADHDVLRTEIDDALDRARNLEECIGSIQDAVRQYLERGPDSSDENKEQVRTRYEELEGSIEGFQSPFGNFPIDSRYVILLFPIVYATAASAFASSQRRLGIIFRSYWEAAIAAGKVPRAAGSRRAYAVMPALPVLNQARDQRSSLAVWIGPIVGWFVLTLGLSLWDSFDLRSWNYASAHDLVMAILVVPIHLLAVFFIFRAYRALKESHRDFGVVQPTEPPSAGRGEGQGTTAGQA